MPETWISKTYDVETQREEINVEDGGLSGPETHLEVGRGWAARSILYPDSDHYIIPGSTIVAVSVAENPSEKRTLVISKKDNAQEEYYLTFLNHHGYADLEGNSSDMASAFEVSEAKARSLGHPQLPRLNGSQRKTLTWSQPLELCLQLEDGSRHTHLANDPQLCINPDSETVSGFEGIENVLRTVSITTDLYNETVLAILPACSRDGEPNIIRLLRQRRFT